MTTRVSLKAKLLLAAFSMVAAFGVCEVGARLLYPIPPELGREPQLLYQSDPDLGFIHVPGQTGHLDDGLATISPSGFRGPEPESPKPANSLRVVAIGDSTTFGWGVDDRDTYTAQLQAMLSSGASALPWSVVNAGVVSYDLEQSVQLLKRVTPRLCPDIVLVGFFWNDLPYEDVSPEGEVQRSRTGAPRAVASRAQAPSAGVRTFRMANQPSGVNWLLRQSRLVFALRHAWLAMIAPTEAATNQVRWEMALLDGRRTDAIDRAWLDVADTFAELRRQADAAGFQVGVLIIPIRAQVDQPFPRAAYQTRAAELAAGQGFFVVDPLPKFVDASDKASLFIPYDRMHLSARGNSLLAEAAFEALQARRVGVTDRDVR